VARVTLVVLLAVRQAAAQVPAGHEGAEGAAADAQPGLGRVGIAEATRPTVAGTVGYGVTEAQSVGDGAHHRGSMKLAFATAVLPWLNVGPSVHGRVDQHRGDGGLIFSGAVSARAVARAQSWRLGLELKPWLPGAESAGTMLRATSLDTRALVGARVGSVVIAGSAGYRLDRGAEAGKDAARLSASDRLALGLSAFDALLLGVGTGIHLDETELLAEASGDLLVGAGAPALMKSPLRLSGGVRQALSRALAAEVLLDVSLSGRPPAGPTAPLVPVEPRFSALAGVRYRFGAEEVAATAPPPPPPARPAPPPPKAPAEVPVPQAASVDAAVKSDQGGPVPDAQVWLELGGARIDLPSVKPGRYGAPQVPAGKGRVHATAEGFDGLESEVTVEAGKPLTLDLVLTALPPPSQVRGVVRSFGGKGLTATIRVEPAGLETTTDATGSFQLDVPPGSYEVVIEAKGYQTQHRKVQLDAQGVVILNADLSKKK